MNEQKLQWNIIEEVKNILLNWSKNNNGNIYKIHFVPMDDFSLEVYVLFVCDDDIVENQTNGNTKLIKDIFIKTITEKGYMKKFNNNISFIFDSNENVIIILKVVTFLD